jgi:hypothetical protein
MRSSERTRAISSGACTGREMKSSAPASSPCVRASRSSSAVSITMGSMAWAGSARSARHTS